MTYTRPLSKDEALEMIGRAVHRARQLFLSRAEHLDLKTINWCLEPVLCAIEDARTDDLVLPKGVFTRDGVEIGTTPGYCDGRPCTCTENLQP